jgi:hypothetical protein
MADGTIPQKQKDILLSMGDWLNKFGESIYNTRAWVIFGEGPTKMGGGEFTDPAVGTEKDIRFTRSKDNTILYAIVLGWPGNNAQLNLTTLNSEYFNISTLTDISLLDTVPGKYISLKDFKQDQEGLKITMPPSKPYNASAYPIKLIFNGKIPCRALPPLDPFEKIEAETFDLRSGMASAERVKDDGWKMSLGVIRSGDHVIYKNFDFHDGASKFLARISCKNETTRIEIRLNGPTGDLLGTLISVNTGDMNTFKDMDCPVKKIKGVHDICLVFRSEENNYWTSLFLNWFVFK